jgi:hypothetical protein
MYDENARWILITRCAKKKRVLVSPIGRHLGFLIGGEPHQNSDIRFIGFCGVKPVLTVSLENYGYFRSSSMSVGNKPGQLLEYNI